MAGRRGQPAGPSTGAAGSFARSRVDELASEPEQWPDHDPEADLEQIYEALQEFGCPICGEETDYLPVVSINAIRIMPCNHTVANEDAIHMERFYKRLQLPEIRGDS